MDLLAGLDQRGLCRELSSVCNNSLEAHFWNKVIALVYCSRDFWDSKCSILYYCSIGYFDPFSQIFILLGVGVVLLIVIRITIKYINTNNTGFHSEHSFSSRNLLPLYLLHDTYCLILETCYLIQNT